MTKISKLLESKNPKDLEGLSIDGLIEELKCNRSVCKYFECSMDDCCNCPFSFSRLKNYNNGIKFLKELKIPKAKFRAGDIVNVVEGGYYYSVYECPEDQYKKFPSVKFEDSVKISYARFSEINNQWWYKLENISNLHTESALVLVDNLIEEAKKRYPIGTKFIPAHVGSKMCIVTNDMFIRQEINKGCRIISLTDEKNHYDSSHNPRYGNTDCNRNVYYDGMWATIISDKPITKEPMIDLFDKNGEKLLIGKTYVADGVQIYYIGCDKKGIPYFEHNKTSDTGAEPNSIHLEDLKALNWIKKGNGKIWSYIGLEKEVVALSSVENNKSVLYKVKLEDLIGEISNIPIDIVQKMIDYQFEQNGYCDIKVFQQNKFASKEFKGFDWNKTKEKSDWGGILKGLFKYFYKHNPKDYFDKNGKKLIVGEKYIVIDNDIFCYCGNNVNNTLLFERISGYRLTSSPIEELEKTFCWDFKSDKKYYLFSSPLIFSRYIEQTNPCNELEMIASRMIEDCKSMFSNSLITNNKNLKFTVGSIVKAKNFSPKFDNEELTITEIKNDYCSFKESDNIPCKFHINNVYEVVSLKQDEKIPDVLVEEFERTPVKPFEFIKY